MTTAETIPHLDSAAFEKSASPQAETPTAIFETSHEDEAIDKVQALRRMSAISGRPPLVLAKELFALSRGPGRVSFRDYIEYRLFDDAFIGDADKSAFVGRYRNQQLNTEINYRYEWNCLSDDKIAHAAYLASYGLPVIPTKAIYAPHARRDVPSLLNTRGKLQSFLSEPLNYPMFGKPVYGFQSLGSIALKRIETGSDSIETSRSMVSIESLIAAIETNFPEGYLFQPQVFNHRDIAGALGAGLSTARIVTIATDDGPRLFAAAWKITGGNNIADNYWRPGNILAAFDPQTGRVSRAITGHGFELREIEHHATTQSKLTDLVLPQCGSMIDVAIEGHRVLNQLGIIGWDIGITDQGPIIVETNVMPDLLLVQAANRTGAFGHEMDALLKRQRANAKAHRIAMKATLVKT